MFGLKMTIIEPVKKRPSFFNGWDTESATYDFVCSACGDLTHVAFKEMLDAAWGWQEMFRPSERQFIAGIFGIDLSNKSIGNGMSAIVTKQCASCEVIHDIYFWFHEYRHSCYDISLRGIARRTTEPEPRADADKPRHSG